jgi:hypothetical protein
MSGAQPDSQRHFDVFVSHAAEDRAIAKRVEALLEQKGYRSFLAVDDLNRLVGTRQWSEAIEQLLGATPILVVLVTAPSLASRWVTFEWRSFHEDILSARRAGLVVPLVWDDQDLDELPTALRHWQIVDIARAGEERGLHELLLLLDGFRSAAIASSQQLERRLRWSSSAMAAASAGASLVPSVRTSSELPSGPGARLARAIWAGSAIGLALLVAVFLSGPLRTPAATGATASSPAATSSSPGAAVETPEREPARGWEPIHAYAHPTLANRNLLARRETWQEARDAFAKLCAAKCNRRQQSALHFVAGELGRLSGEGSAAMQAFEQATITDPSWALAKVGLATVNIDARPEHARMLAREAYEADSSLWIALSVKGAAYARQQKYVEAIQEMIEARGRAPAECRALLDGQLAVTYHAEGLRAERATELARGACTKTERVAPACAVLAEQALESNDPAAALRYCDLADRDDFVPLLLARGDALQIQGKLALAWLAWRRALSLKDRADAQGTPMQRLSAIDAAVASGRPPPRRAGRSRQSAVLPTQPGAPAGMGLPAAPPEFARPASGVHQRL